MIAALILLVCCSVYRIMPASCYRNHTLLNAEAVFHFRVGNLARTVQPS